MNRKSKKFVIITEILLFLLVIVFHFKPSCIIKSITHIPCPGCGMTRAFKLIIKGKLLQALSQNIISVPLFISIIIVNICLIMDIINSKRHTEKIINILLNRKYIILALLLISEIYNIIYF